jgi:hypothetical protein
MNLTAIFKIRIFRRLFLLLGAGLGLGAGVCTAATNGLTQGVYVWQRDWNEPVRTAVAAHAGQFQEVVALTAEVSWQQGQPKVVPVALDYAALKAAGTPVGLALRIGPYPGLPTRPAATNGLAAGFMAGLAAGLVAEVAAHGLAVGELQLDFDCASSRLDGYRAWVEVIRRRVAPVPVVITVLPDWLKQPAFGRLAAATDGYVLQVHSLTAPAGVAAPFTLCDPAAARRAVVLDGEFKVPFRVALPTYGYVLAFDRAGKLIGLSADGPARDWPADAQLREVRTDPSAMAGLVRLWATNHPATLRGSLWYRLPVATDGLNLRWPTVAAMMAGQPPQPHTQAVAVRTSSGLTEIHLVNDGELDLTGPVGVAVHWADARLVAGDGIGGFALAEDGPVAARWQNPRPGFRLLAGETQTIGWLRLSDDGEVQCEVVKN